MALSTMESSSEPQEQPAGNQRGEKVNYLVVDSGALIRNAPIHEMGEHIYTTSDVVKEIRDKATLARLQVLPYELHLKEPDVEYVKFVSEFAKKTGDYITLSAVDIKVIALTFMLEDQFNGVGHLRKEPPKTQTKSYDESVKELAKPLPGFYNPKGNEDDEECNEEDDDETGWITVGNLDSIKKEMAKLTITDEPPKADPDRVTIGCVTTDFAMQNVILQIGLHLISFDGSVIKETKNFILRCYACFKTTTNMESKFCKSCGNQGTLKRVAVTINENGEQVIHINFKRPINIRGTRYTIPAPKPGKHANNPILAPDQPLPQHKATKFAIQERGAVANMRMLTDPDYTSTRGENPFAMNDVYSKASQMGYTRNPQRVSRVDQLVPGRPRNPNMSKPSTGNKKKSRN